jgi:hypothetical protein
METVSSEELRRAESMRKVREVQIHNLAVEKKLQRQTPLARIQLSKAERKGKTPEEIAELRLRKFRKLSLPSFLA